MVPGRPRVRSGRDDTLIVMFMCCHPALLSSVCHPSHSACRRRPIDPPDRQCFPRPGNDHGAAHKPGQVEDKSRGGQVRPTVAQRSAPSACGRCCTSLYLIFNEGYATSSGPDLGRPDLGGEGIRPARMTQEALPEDPEVSGLLALMLLTEARRPARRVRTPTANSSPSRTKTGNSGTEH